MIRKSVLGFSLIESLMIVAMVGIIVILMANLPNAMNLVNKSKNLSLIKEIATKQIEDKRAISYANLANGSVAISDQRLNTVADASGTVLIEDCSVDVCPNEEHIKQVTVTLNWKENNKVQTITLKTLIGEGGLNQ